MNNEYNHLYNILSESLQTAGTVIRQTQIDKGWKITTEKDWEDPNEIPAILMLIVSEASEALEAFRKNDKEGFNKEVADIMIRTIGLSKAMNIDLAEEMVNKMQENLTRSHKHGGKKL